MTNVPSIEKMPESPEERFDLSALKRIHELVEKKIQDPAKYLERVAEVTLKVDEDYPKIAAERKQEIGRDVADEEALAVLLKTQDDLEELDSGVRTLAA